MSQINKNGKNQSLDAVIFGDEKYNFVPLMAYITQPSQLQVDLCNETYQALLKSVLKQA